jgi:hypothetical protein
MSALSSLAAPCNHLPARLIPLSHSGPLKTQQGMGVWLGWVCEAAISIHALISSLTVPLLSRSGVNY